MYRGLSFDNGPSTLRAFLNLRQHTTAHLPIQRRLRWVARSAPAAFERLAGSQMPLGLMLMVVGFVLVAARLHQRGLAIDRYEARRLSNRRRNAG